MHTDMYIKAHLSFAILYIRNVTFICGRSGVCALGAVLAKQAGDQRLLDHYISQFKQVNLPDYIFVRLLEIDT